MLNLAEADMHPFLYYCLDLVAVMLVLFFSAVYMSYKVVARIRKMLTPSARVKSD